MGRDERSLGARCGRPRSAVGTGARRQQMGSAERADAPLFFVEQMTPGSVQVYTFQPLRPLLGRMGIFTRLAGTLGI